MGTVHTSIVPNVNISLHWILNIISHLSLSHTHPHINTLSLSLSLSFSLLLTCVTGRDLIFGTPLQELEHRLQQLTDGQEEVCPYIAMQPCSAMQYSLTAPCSATPRPYSATQMRKTPNAP